MQPSPAQNRPIDESSRRERENSSMRQTATLAAATTDRLINSSSYQPVAQVAAFEYQINDRTLEIDKRIDFGRFDDHLSIDLLLFLRFLYPYNTGNVWPIEKFFPKQNRFHVLGEFGDQAPGRPRGRPFVVVLESLPSADNRCRIDRRYGAVVVVALAPQLLRQTPQKSPMSATARPTRTCTSREKDKIPRRSSGATKSIDGKEKQPVHTNSHEKTEKPRTRNSELPEASRPFTRLQARQQGATSCAKSKTKASRLRAASLCVSPTEAAPQGKKSVIADHLGTSFSRKPNIPIAAEILKANRPEEAGLSHHQDLKIHCIDEADEEPKVFYQAFDGMNKQLYMSLNGIRPLNHTPRLFNLSSVSGEFAATELFCPHRTEQAMPFPFLQNELYQVNQPALFLLDNEDELWLWQGWWLDGGSEDQTGSGAVRWQAERRAAMVMAVRYWKKRNPDSNECPIYLAWAGLEPLSFTNLFPSWTLHDEIAELNIRDGRDPGQVLKVEGELARLTQSTYPPAQLLQRLLPEGVDPTILEKYLSPQHFEELLGMNVEDYEQLPAWKQINIKKKIGLF